ncbi:MAG: MarR family winged helix-turn-helix transcriptional regulator [Cyclobacteriaceae bacterium]
MRLEDEIKQAHFRNYRQKVFLNIVYSGNWLHAKQQEFFKPYGITGQQFNILRILRGQHPKKISGIEIKSRMLDRNSDVSRLLDRLIAKKLVTKEPSEKDKRAADVGISDQGLELLQVIDKKMESLDSLINSLTEEEAKVLNQLLDKMRG